MSCLCMDLALNQINVMDGSLNSCNLHNIYTLSVHLCTLFPLCKTYESNGSCILMCVKGIIKIMFPCFYLMCAHFCNTSTLLCFYTPTLLCFCAFVLLCFCTPLLLCFCASIRLYFYVCFYALPHFEKFSTLLSFRA